MSPPLWACGAAGSALPWHGRGHRFDPDQVHQSNQQLRAHIPGTGRIAGRRPAGSCYFVIWGLQDNQRDIEGEGCDEFCVWFCGRSAWWVVNGGEDGADDGGTGSMLDCRCK